MVPLYAARIEDLGPGDLVRVECAAGGHDVLNNAQRAAAKATARAGDPRARSGIAFPLPRVRCARDGGRVGEVGRRWLGAALLRSRLRGGNGTIRSRAVASPSAVRVVPHIEGFRTGTRSSRIAVRADRSTQTHRNSEMSFDPARQRCHAPPARLE